MRGDGVRRNGKEGSKVQASLVRQNEQREGTEIWILFKVQCKASEIKQ